MTDTTQRNTADIHGSLERQHFQLFFERSPHPYLVLEPSPAFIIIAVNDSYLSATGTQRNAILGRGLFEVFPDNPDDPAATGTSDLRSSLERVLSDRVRDVMGVQKYDIPGETGFQVKYWSPVNTPVFDEKNTIVAIIHHVEDVTEFMLLREREREWAQQSVTVDRMEAEVLRRATEVKEANRQLKTAKTELERREAELVQLNERLRELDRAKSEFLASMSHEIRTPLNGVLGMADLLEHTALDDTQRSFVKTIRNSGKTLLAVINDILDFSKVEAGKMKLNEQPFDLTEMLEEVISPFRASSHQHVALIASIAPHTPPHLIGDAVRLQQILGNLLNNAFKFTEQGSVAVRVEPKIIEPQRTQLLFQVIDTGIGIDPDNQKRLFQPFSQVEQTQRRYGGTGLGLLICQRLVHLMEGDIGVSSEPGRGSVFSFSVWLKRSAEPVAKRAEIDLSGKKLLAIDDCDDYLRIICEQAKALGMRVEGVRQPEQAIAAANAFRPDIITFDLDMPELNGFALDKKFSAAPQLAAIPRILLTASSAPPSTHELMHTGFCAAHIKPTSPTQLQTILSLALLGKRSPRETTSTKSTPLYTGNRILVADDNAINRQVITAMLKQLDIAAEIVDDGALAQQKATDPALHFDAILMDCEMPGIDGYQATKLIRRYESASGRSPTPIIALTAHALPEHRQRSLDAGMNDHLAKPINLGALAEVLGRYLKPKSMG